MAKVGAVLSKKEDSWAFCWAYLALEIAEGDRCNIGKGCRGNVHVACPVLSQYQYVCYPNELTISRG